MKRLIALAAFIALAGAGCAKAPAFDGTAYENAQYRFAFDYPANMDLRTRPDDVRQTQYAGIDVDFFASLRDTAKEAKPLNVAAFYAAPGLSADAFEERLEASGAGIEVTARAQEKHGKLSFTKVVSTTESGEAKTHYLLERDGHTVVISVFLSQEEAFAPVLGTFRAYRP